MNETVTQVESTRTLSYRAVLIGVVAMVWMGMWIHFHEVLVPQPSPLAENSPPLAAVGLLLGVVIACGLLQLIRRGLGLHRGEMLVVYCMLVIAAPLMSQGMWHRFLGLVVAIPHHKHNMDLIDSYSPALWPHGEPLVTRPVRLDDPNVTASHPQRVRAIDIERSQVGPTRGIRFDAKEVGSDATTTLTLRVPRDPDNPDSLQPGERFYCTALLRVRALAVGGRIMLQLRSDGGTVRDVLTLTRTTQEAYAHLGGFVRRGEPYVDIPRDTRQSVSLVLTLEGAGVVDLADVQLFSNEALAQMHKGVSEATQSELSRIPPDRRDALLARPDELTSPEGLLYTLRGYIPWRQWIRPLGYWGVIVLAMFLCTLGIAIVFRKQWAEHERFAFPMIVVPQMLIEARAEHGDSTRALIRHPAFMSGVGAALLYTLLLGLAQYIPGFPNPKIEIPLDQYFGSPAMKAAVNGFGGRNQFTVVLVFVAIAFFVDLQLLASVLIFFLISLVPWYFGERFGWKTISGPVDDFPFPHEQHIGAFLCLAGLVLWISRRHLAEVWRHVIGAARGGDAGEAMRYRTAVLMIVASFGIFAGWGAMTGLGVGSALLFFGFMIVCALAAARIRTEFGAPWTYFTPYFPYLIFSLLGGLAVFGTQTMLLAYFAGGFMAVAQFLMFAPSQVEMVELARRQHARPVGVKWALILGAIGGVLIGGYVMLVWAYGVGGENIDYMRGWAINQDWYFRGLRQGVNDMNRMSMNPDAEPAGLPVAPLSAVGIGAAVTLAISALRMHLVGFWLHPIGYVLANTFFIYSVWGSVLVAMGTKWLALKIGGPRLLRRQLTPFFVGVFCGAVIGVILWDILALYAWSNGSTEVHVIFP